eukprot:jgi/Mesvir1/2061/Mv02318-RA.4
MHPAPPIHLCSTAQPSAKPQVSEESQPPATSFHRGEYTGDGRGEPQRANWFGELLTHALVSIGVCIAFHWAGTVLRKVAEVADPNRKASTQTAAKGNGKSTIATPTVRFKDVAGCDEAKREVMEFVDFLKNPGKYKELGAKMPRGALLVGPPGTGKTMLAKALAGEAGVSFFIISGSAFVEMYVGVGASRVRDVFAQARKHAPCIVYIDEIDAVGRARTNHNLRSGADDERDSTLNQLLVEMDGFASTSDVIVLASTNRPDTLDKALLRPGRFDRQISIDCPDIKGREQIFKRYLEEKKLDKEVDHYAQRLAALTPGFAGADIANVVNEAAILACRRDSHVIAMEDFNAACDRVICGLERKNLAMSQEDRRRVAIHEAGHAVVGWFLQHAHPVLKVTIVPRATSLGFTQYLPKESGLQTKEMMDDLMCATLGGRAAEKVLLGSVSTGASDDLEKATKMARDQVTLYGFSNKLGLMSFTPGANNTSSTNKPFSERTAQRIDEEVRALLDASNQQAEALVRQHKCFIEQLAEALLQKEVVHADDMVAIMGPRPFAPAAEVAIDDKHQMPHVGQGGASPDTTPLTVGVADPKPEAPAGPCDDAKGDTVSGGGKEGG